MLRDLFWLDGESAAERRIILSKEIEFEAAEPVTESIKIPGRDVEVLYYDGSYKNVRGLAKCFVLDHNAAMYITDINAWLLSKTGYRRLQTLHEPDIYRMARVVHGARMDPRLNTVNAFDIEFDCCPYKYFAEGEKAVDIGTSAELVGPTSFISLPLITVQGSGQGTLVINGRVLTLDDCDGITLDAETRDAKKGTANANGTISGVFPYLEKQNIIEASGGITGITITPRWRTI